MSYDYSDGPFHPKIARRTMNPSVKLQWIHALESGEYKQITGVLKDECGFCALGVLCDLYVKEHRMFWDGGTVLSENACLPTQIREWAGLPDCSPNVFRPYDPEEDDDYADEICLLGDDKVVNINIVEANDDGTDFKTLASWIRESF